MGLVLTLLECPVPQTTTRRALLKGTLLIGRGADCDWVLADPERQISKHHAEIVFEGGRAVLRDLSTNGVFIGDSDAPVGLGNTAPLRLGMRLRMGGFVFAVGFFIPRLRPAADETVPDEAETPPTEGQSSGGSAKRFIDKDRKPRVVVEQLVEPTEPVDLADFDTLLETTFGTSAPEPSGPKDRGAAPDKPPPGPRAAEHGERGGSALPDVPAVSGLAVENPPSAEPVPEDWDAPPEERAITGLAGYLSERADSTPPKRFGRGRALFNPPRRMWVGLTETVQLRLRPGDVLSTLERAQIERGMHGRGPVREETVPRLGARMTAVLHCEDDALAIKPLGTAEQDIDLRGVTHWDWSVRPLHAGQAVLVLRLTLKKDLSGAEIQSDLEAMRAVVAVEVRSVWSRPAAFWRDNWKWVVGLLVGIPGTVTAWAALFQ